MKKIATLIFSLSLIAGCGLFESSDNQNIHVQGTFQLQENHYHKAENIEATFINKSSHTVYRVRPSCSKSWLQMKIDNNWKQLYYQNKHVVCPAGVMFYPIEVSEKIQISIPFEVLEQMVKNTEGTYRFSEVLSPRNVYQNTEHTVVTSAEFTIE